MTFDVAPRLVETKDGRTVGYRRFGKGPPVALLHASPRSAAALLPLGLMLAERFTVFAFDTPGFGWSDALPIARPDAADFGDALIGAFDALGLVRAPVYGSHTGAAIAVAAAQRHPHRVPALVLDGYAMFTATEQAEYLATYLAPLNPEWEGTHLAFLWSRVKDQFTWFPWYLRGQVARIPRPLASLAFMQGVIVDFLAAGNNYRPGYAAAFRFDGDGELRALGVPTTVMARTDDLLFGHLDLLTAMPGNIAVQRVAADNTAWGACVADALAPHTGGTSPALPEASGRGADIVRVSEGTIGVTRFGGPSDARPLILLSGIPGSSRGETDLARALCDTRRVYGIDLPGFGGSALSAGADAASIAAALRAAATAIGIAAFDVVALGESAAIGCMLAEPVANARIVMVDPVDDSQRGALIAQMTDIRPRGDGTHLLAAWHQLRDTCLWRPWFAPTPANALDFGVDPDVPRLQRILLDWMRGGSRARDTIAAALAAPRPTLPGRTHIVRTTVADKRVTAVAILLALDAAP